MIEIKQGINPREVFPNIKHVIEYAFSIGNRDYYQFDDVFNTHYDRALKCLVYYKELDMNCDRAFIKAHTEAVDNILSASKIDLGGLLKFKQLNDMLKQRLELPKEPDLMYKFASVVFFDQFENPSIYEFKYGEQKIKHWKKETSLTDFFLSKPLKELIPYLQHAGENLQMFSQMTEKAQQQHLDNLLPLLSEAQKIALQGK